MPKSLVAGAMVSLQGTDLAAVVVDLSSKRQRMAIDQTIMKLLGEHRTTPSVLVLNKLDSIRDRYSMLPTIDNLTCGRLLSPLQPGENGIRYTKPDKEEVFQLNRGWPNFHEVLIVSARTGEGLDRLKACYWHSTSLSFLSLVDLEHNLKLTFESFSMSDQYAFGLVGLPFLFGLSWSLAIQF